MEKACAWLWGKNVHKSLCVAVLSIAFAHSVHGDTPGERTTWSELVKEGESLVFGRFEGKFDSPEFRSRRIRLKDIQTGVETLLTVDDGLGYIAESMAPGTYNVVSLEAVFFPNVHPFRPDRYRPIRQRFGVRPKSGDAQNAVIVVPADRPVYIGTIKADVSKDGVIYRGHQLRILDEFDSAYDRLGKFYPGLLASLEHAGIVPARHFMLKPTRTEEPLARVVGLEDPIKQAREYIAEGKFKQAVNWLETFMPTSDAQRSEARLLIGEALLADRRYPEAIEELGEVLLANPAEKRALRLLARAHAFNRNLADAENLYQALAEAVPDDAEAHLHLGYLYALQDKEALAQREFFAAFQTDFDYLLHDGGPFFVAMRAVFEEEVAQYEPPRVVKFTVPPPRAMDSRRSAQNNAIAVLIDHTGKVIAAHMGSQSAGSAPLMMLSLVKATFAPASLNGIPIPALLTMGASGGGQAQ